MTRMPECRTKHVIVNFLLERPVGLTRGRIGKLFRDDICASFSTINMASRVDSPPEPWHHFDRITVFIIVIDAHALSHGSVYLFSRLFKALYHEMPRR